MGLEALGVPMSSTKKRFTGSRLSVLSRPLGSQRLVGSQPPLAWRLRRRGARVPSWA
jgi:hypothetical protein